MKAFKKPSIVSSIVRSLSITACFAFLSACGGGGGGGSAGPSPDGVYTGSITDGAVALNGGEKGVVYNNRMIVISMPFEIQQIFDAQLVTSSTDLTATNVPIFGQ